MKKYGIEEIICGISFVVMLAITFLNVVSRYVLHMSMSFSEEVVVALFVLVSTAGGAIAAKDESHYTLDLATGNLAPRMKKIVSIISHILSCIVCIVLLITSIEMVQAQFWIGSKSVALKIPEGLYGSFVPIGMTFMVIRFAQVAMRKIRELKEEEN